MHIKLRNRGSLTIRSRDPRPTFVRSDVYAQLLRARLCGTGAVAADMTAAAEEARWLEEFQSDCDDTRLAGGFYFGRRDGELIAHLNPVSTAFAAQALELWQTYRSDSGVRCPLPI